MSILTIVGELSKAIMTTTGHSLIVFGGGGSALPLRDLPLLLQAEPKPGSHGTLATAALSLRLIAALPSAVHVATIFVATVFLLRALRGIRDGAPFHPLVLQSINHLSIVLLAGGIIEGLASTGGSVYIGSRIGLLFGNGLVPDQQKDQFLGGAYQSIGVDSPQWPIALLIGGRIALALALALALAVAFRAGARFQREADGVI